MIDMKKNFFKHNYSFLKYKKKSHLILKIFNYLRNHWNHTELYSSNNNIYIRIQIVFLWKNKKNENCFIWNLIFKKIEYKNLLCHVQMQLKYGWC